MHGELIPLGGGDPIPLLKKNLLVGRRESCDIVLRFSNVSAHHCQLYCNGGYWYVKDLKSRNGIRVNGSRVTEKRLDPGDELSIAKHRYDVRYSPYDLGAVGPPPVDEEATDMMKQSLLERAGLEMRGKHPAASSSKERTGEGRYDVLDDGAGQIKDPNQPI
ncbi:MAG: FHA domain-containing protein [Pirellulales bacterium]